MAQATCKEMAACLVYVADNYVLDAILALQNEGQQHYSPALVLLQQAREFIRAQAILDDIDHFLP